MLFISAVISFSGWTTIKPIKPLPLSFPYIYDTVVIITYINYSNILYDGAKTRKHIRYSFSVIIRRLSRKGTETFDLSAASASSTDTAGSPGFSTLSQNASYLSGHLSKRKYIYMNIEIVKCTNEIRAIFWPY